jgi:hypothetical protein
MDLKMSEEERILDDFLVRYNLKEDSNPRMGLLIALVNVDERLRQLSGLPARVTELEQKQAELFRRYKALARKVKSS